MGGERAPKNSPKKQEPAPAFWDWGLIPVADPVDGEVVPLHGAPDPVYDIPDRQLDVTPDVAVLSADPSGPRPRQPIQHNVRVPIPGLRQ